MTAQILAGLGGLIALIGLVIGVLLKIFNSGKAAQQNADLKEQVRVDKTVDAQFDSANAAGDRVRNDPGGLRNNDGYRRD